MMTKTDRMRIFSGRRRLAAIGVLLFCTAGAVQAAQPPQPPNAPQLPSSSSRFQEIAGSNGSIVRDNSTGLEWQRCPHGQIWTDSGCRASAWEGSWDEAVRLTAPGGFRLPTAEELRRIAPCDVNVFPGPYWFWSSSPAASNTAYAWFLYTADGSVISYKKVRNHVRLVRDGP